jgi:hypothetical protein
MYLCLYLYVYMCVCVYACCLAKWNHIFRTAIALLTESDIVVYMCVLSLVSQTTSSQLIRYSGGRGGNEDVEYLYTQVPT